MKICKLLKHVYVHVHLNFRSIFRSTNSLYGGFERTPSPDSIPVADLPPGAPGIVSRRVDYASTD